MLSLTDKSRIVNSYSNVLTGILSSRADFEEVLNGLKSCIENEKLSDLQISPVNVKEYKQLLKSLLLSVDVGDNLQKFVFTLMSRRYLNLLGEIVSASEHKMRKMLKYDTIIVVSGKELDARMQQQIMDVIEKQTGKKSNVIYKQDARIEGDNIELRANGNVCVLNVLQLTKSIFSVQKNSLLV